MTNHEKGFIEIIDYLASEVKIQVYDIDEEMYVDPVQSIHKY